jgi:hypothetical protein
MHAEKNPNQRADAYADHVRSNICPLYGEVIQPALQEFQGQAEEDATGESMPEPGGKGIPGKKV